MNSQGEAVEAGEAELKEERGRSSVEFTYNDLDDSVAVVTAVHRVGGTSCSLKALAAAMDQSPTGGGFRMKVYSARGFGLLQLSRGSVDLTDLGLHILDGKHVKQARVSAFLNVPLYRMIFDQLEGRPLPPPAAIERMMLQAGVTPKQKERARQVFIRSAKSAGFFDIHADRLVRPEIRDSVATTAPAPKPAETELVAPPERRTPRFYGGGGGGEDGGGIHPAILGLLRDLPAAGTPLNAKRKDQLKAAFASNIDFIYPDPEE